MASFFVPYPHFVVLALIASFVPRLNGISCNSNTGISSYYLECDSEDDGCWGLYGLGAYCDVEENQCKCSGSYNTDTCLPDTLGCTMCNFNPVNGEEPGNPSSSNSYSNNNYGCVNDDIKDYSNIEVRMIGVYESSEGEHGHGQPRTSGEITVYLENCNGGGSDDFDHKIVLYLGSYEPVDWIITPNDDAVNNSLQLYEVYVSSYYTSTVTLDILDAPEMGIVDGGQYPTYYGYVKDTGGGNTAGMIENVYTLWGVEPYSFIGTYRTKEVTLCVGAGFANATSYAYIPSSTEGATDSPTQSTTQSATESDIQSTTQTVIEEAPGINCNSNTGIASYYLECDSEDSSCWGLYGLGPYCDVEENQCKCSGSYNANTCLPDTLGCTMCNFSPANNQEPGNPSSLDSYSNNNYGCVNEDVRNYSNIEVRMIGVYESSEGKHGHGQPRTAGEITVYLENCNGGGSDDFDHKIVLYLGSYEPVNWIITSDDDVVNNNLQLYEVYMSSYYTSTVTLDNLDAPEMGIVDAGQYQSRGYGEDTGGGNTVGMIENVYTLYGVEPYSFIGTYRTNEVTLCVGGAFTNATGHSYNYLTSTEGATKSTSESTGTTGDYGEVETKSSNNKNSDSSETLIISLGVILPIIAMVILVVVIYYYRNKLNRGSKFVSTHSQTSENLGETTNFTDYGEGHTNSNQQINERTLGEGMIN